MWGSINEKENQCEHAWMSELLLGLEPMDGSFCSFRQNILKLYYKNNILKDFSNTSNGSWDNFSKS